MRLLTILFLLITVRSFGQVDPEDYAVYSTIINEELKTDTVDNKSLLILKSTFSKRGVQSIIDISEFIKTGQPVTCNYADNINELLGQRPEIKDLILHLDSIKQNDRQLSTNLKVDSQYKLISRNKFESLLKKDGIEKLRQKNVGLFGLFEFSQVAFSGDYAVVYCGQYIRSLNAVGTIMVLKKDNGKWKIISRPEIWVS